LKLLNKGRNLYKYSGPHKDRIIPIIKCIRQQNSNSLNAIIILPSHTVFLDYSSAQVHYSPSPQEVSSMRHIVVLAPSDIGIGTPALQLLTQVDSDSMHSSSVSNIQRTSPLPKVRQQPQLQRQYLQSRRPKY
jgi:hypothetical protein